MKEQNKNLPTQQDIKNHLARGNVLQARRLEQQIERAKFAKQLARRDNLILAS
jgi:hypothetical protein